MYAGVVIISLSARNTFTRLWQRKRFGAPRKYEREDFLHAGYLSESNAVLDSENRAAKLPIV
jgi:hypothetical protein